MTPQPSTASYYSTPTPLYLAHFPGGCHGDGKAAVSKGSVEDLPLLSGLIFSVSLSIIAHQTPNQGSSFPIFAATVVRDSQWEEVRTGRKDRAHYLQRGVVPVSARIESQARAIKLRPDKTTYCVGVT